MSNKYHCTHTNPDLDAGLSSWQVLRFIYGIKPGEALPVKFVNTGNPDPELLANAHSVSDTGKVFNTATLRFDHHQFSGRSASGTCAAEQVYSYLLLEGMAERVLHLAPLVDLVTLGDAGIAPKSSYEYGLHALLSGFRHSIKEREGRNATDMESLEFMFEVLDVLNVLYERNLVHSELDFRVGDYADLIAINQMNRQKIQAELETLVKWRSHDGRVVAIENGSPAHSFALYEQGCVLSVFKNTEGLPVEGETKRTYPVGVSRNPEWTSPHVGEVLGQIDSYYRLAGNSQWDVITAEISEWYRHETGFFAGRGTAKAPVLRDAPPEFSLVELAKAIDYEWGR